MPCLWNVTEKEVAENFVPVRGRIFMAVLGGSLLYDTGWDYTGKSDPGYYWVHFTAAGSLLYHAKVDWKETPLSLMCSSNDSRVGRLPFSFILFHYRL